MPPAKRDPSGLHPAALPCLAIEAACAWRRSLFFGLKVVSGFSSILDIFPEDSALVAPA